MAEAACETHGKGYAHLYVIGFAIQPNARALVEQCDGVFGVAATYVQATRFDDGRFIKDHAVEPDFQRPRHAGPAAA